MQSRALIRYGLEVMTRLAELVRRVVAGETILDNINSSEEKTEVWRR